jgi:hypothetical protein
LQTKLQGYLFQIQVQKHLRVDLFIFDLPDNFSDDSYDQEETESVRLRREAVKRLLEQPAEELPDESAVCKTTYEEILLKVDSMESIFWRYKFDRRIYRFHNGYCTNDEYPERVGLRKSFYVALDFMFLRYMTRPNTSGRGFSPWTRPEMLAYWDKEQEGDDWYDTEGHKIQVAVKITSRKQNRGVIETEAQMKT